jgi:hypothetical protein
VIKSIHLTVTSGIAVAVCLSSYAFAEESFFARNQGLHAGTLPDGSPCSLEIAANQRGAEYAATFTYTSKQGRTRNVTIDASRFDGNGELPFVLAITGFLVENHYALNFDSFSDQLIRSFLVREGVLGVLKDGDSYECVLER